MPLNESGNNKQAPPDLEEILKKFLQEVKALFNIKNKAGSGNTGKITQRHFGLVAGFIVAIWFLSGFIIVAPAEKAVVLLFGKYYTTLGPGPHWVARFIESPYIINEQKISNYSYESQMLTKDENIVSVALAIQYRIVDARDYLFNVVNPNGSLQQATASALRQVIGRTTLDEVLTRGRERIRQEIKISLENILKRYKTGLLITDVAMQPARAPDEVKEAFDDAIKAQEDEQRFINQSQAYAMQVIPTAKGEAQRIAADARAYKAQVILNAKGDVATFLPLLAAYKKAPLVTGERLYLDTIESVLTATSKVLVTANNNNLFYLSLDKWLSPNNSNKPLPFMLDTKTAPITKNNADQPKDTSDSTKSDEQRGY
jgi:modulator of FtsH protease HflK